MFYCLVMKGGSRNVHTGCDTMDDLVLDEPEERTDGWRAFCPVLSCPVLSFPVTFYATWPPPPPSPSAVARSLWPPRPPPPPLNGSLHLARERAVPFASCQCVSRCAAWPLG
jgi:hypothetical protein